MKVISCGILIFVKGKLLLGHPTNSKWDAWNIPKGHLEEGESFEECALREVIEETGLDLSNEFLKDLGLFEYLPKKDLYLFSCEIDVEVDQCFCHSYVRDAHGKDLFPEFDSFKFVDVAILETYVSKNVYNVLTKAREKM